MLTEVNSNGNHGFGSQRKDQLWHNGTLNTPSLGCQRCFERSVCGGLQLKHSLYDCLGFCCGNPSECDRICRNRAEAIPVAVREVDGWDLDNVPRTQVLEHPPLPCVVPVIYHRGRRANPFQAPTVCLRLYDVALGSDDPARYKSRPALTGNFGVREDATIILTGTDEDAPIERWWSLGRRRLDLIRNLRELGIALVTTPNFSMFTDRPRWDDLHSMKRIAIVQEEFAREGLPAALHINARTERDWERWTRYISDRNEITHIAVEFATGAGWATRTAWHVEQLSLLGRAVGRPLHLILRGGLRSLPMIAAAFERCTLLETTTFMKTVKRQKAICLSSSAIKWQQSPTSRDQTLDCLLDENWRTVEAVYKQLFASSHADKPAA